MPVWIVGIEPASWDPIKNRYDRMYRVATDNGVICHGFETVFGSALAPQVPGVDAADELPGGELPFESESDPGDGNDA